MTAIETLRDLLLSSATEILTAVTAGAVLYVRAWVQKRVALIATSDQEGMGMPGVEKKQRALASVRKRLPMGVRPLTEKGLDKLVEEAVPEAKKRTSTRPGAADA